MRDDTFKERLRILMRGQRPYAWCDKIGIKRGLFQYYWERGGMPTVENIVKIQRFTGCSYEWLLKGSEGGQLKKGQNISQLAEEIAIYGINNTKLKASMAKLKMLYSVGNKAEINHLEFVLSKMMPEPTKDRPRKRRQK